MMCFELNGTSAENMNRIQPNLIKEGQDIPFGSPLEEYSYRCSHCFHEMQVNEAIIDVEVAVAECTMKDLCLCLDGQIVIMKQWNMLRTKSPLEGCQVLYYT